MMHLQLTFGFLLLSGFIAVHANHKATFMTSPVHVEKSGLTRVTHLPHTSHCSLPQDLSWRKGKRKKTAGQGEKDKMTRNKRLCVSVIPHKHTVFLDPVESSVLCLYELAELVSDEREDGFWCLKVYLSPLLVLLVLWAARPHHNRLLICLLRHRKPIHTDNAVLTVRQTEERGGKLVHV